jgi:hypothetical protein
LPATLEDTVEAMLEDISSRTPSQKPKPIRPLQDATPESDPFISVIVPANGSPRGLPRVLDRLAAAGDLLRRRFGKRAEIIVSGYGEHSRRLFHAEEFDARVISRNLPTLSAAVNAGAAVARGEFLVLLEPGLSPREECLCHICETLTDGTTVGGGTAVSVKRAGVVSALTAFLAQIPLRLNGLSLGVCFVRKQAFDRLGGFRESMLSGQTLEFALRLKRHAAATGRRLANVKKVCATAHCDCARLSAKEWCMLLVFPLLRRW